MRLGFYFLCAEIFLACSPAEPASAPKAHTEPTSLSAPPPEAPDPLSTAANESDAGATPAEPPPEPVVDDKGCVRDVKRHATKIALEKYASEISEALGQAAKESDLDPNKCATVTDLGDVDGDGKPDSDVSLCLPPGGHVWRHYVYFSNKGCTKAADQLVQAELVVLDSKSKGVNDLESTGANSCAGNDFTWTRFKWTGSAYRVADTATCHLCTDEGHPKAPAGANRHAYCKKQAALRKKNP